MNKIRGLFNNYENFKNRYVVKRGFQTTSLRNTLKKKIDKTPKICPSNLKIDESHNSSLSTNRYQRSFNLKKQFNRT